MTDVHRVKGLQGDNHVYTVIRPQDCEQTIVFDSYLAKIYLEDEIPQYMTSYLYDESTNTGSYIPYNIEQHAIDEDVIAELIEDG